VGDAAGQVCRACRIDLRTPFILTYNSSCHQRSSSPSVPSGISKSPDQTGYSSLDSIMNLSLSTYSAQCNGSCFPSCDAATCHRHTRSPSQSRLLTILHLSHSTLTSNIGKLPCLSPSAASCHSSGMYSHARGSHQVLPPSIQRLHMLHMRMFAANSYYWSSRFVAVRSFND